MAKGLVGLGGVAKTTEEQAANAVAFLEAQTEFSTVNAEKQAKIIEALKIQEEIRAGGYKVAMGLVVLNSEQVKLLENREKALKAAAGMQIQLMQAVEKEKLAQEKTLATLRQ